MIRETSAKFMLGLDFHKVLEQSQMFHDAISVFFNGEKISSQPLGLCRSQKLVQ